MQDEEKILKELGEMLERVNELHLNINAVRHEISRRAERRMNEMSAEAIKAAGGIFASRLQKVFRETTDQLRQDRNLGEIEGIIRNFFLEMYHLKNDKLFSSDFAPQGHLRDRIERISTILEKLEITISLNRKTQEKIDKIEFMEQELDDFKKEFTVFKGLMKKHITDSEKVDDVFEKIDKLYRDRDGK